jgi:hypothetical protein
MRANAVDASQNTYLSRGDVTKYVEKQVAERKSVT